MAIKMTRKTEDVATQAFGPENLKTAEFLWILGCLAFDQTTDQLGSVRHNTLHETQRLELESEGERLLKKARAILKKNHIENIPRSWRTPAENFYQVSW